MKCLFNFLTLLLFLSSNNILAHHAFAAEFDRNKPVSFTGTVTEMNWSNPHAWIYIDVVDSSGDVVNWALETRAANNLIRLGWRPGDLPVGTVLEIRGWQARNDSPTASLSEATLPDGRQLFSGSPD
ncbi:MAG: hypothetical protein CMM56_03225 [Rhodospirillaceae bacterium]|nr:hypothetical protein [Rhodospirillaceae bacterium]|tara:strand:+ start:13650 stop:14030 length:381 start_codon:yes stop_codon:yes gene_type:complete